MNILEGIDNQRITLINHRSWTLSSTTTTVQLIVQCQQMSECPIENWTVVCYFAESAKQNRYIYTRLEQPLMLTVKNLSSHWRQSRKSNNHWPNWWTVQVKHRTASASPLCRHKVWIACVMDARDASLSTVSSCSRERHQFVSSWANTMYRALWLHWMRM